MIISSDPYVPWEAMHKYSQQYVVLNLRAFFPVPFMWATINIRFRVQQEALSARRNTVVCAPTVLSASVVISSLLSSAGSWFKLKYLSLVELDVGNRISKGGSSRSCLWSFKSYFRHCFKMSRIPSRIFLNTCMGSASADHWRVYAAVISRKLTTFWVWEVLLITPLPLRLITVGLARRRRYCRIWVDNN